jgi:hypothetical protein
LVRHELDGRTLRLTYRRDAAEEVQRIVQLERSSCAFLDFLLVDGAEGCVLAITTPEGTKDAARWLFAQFLPGDTASVPTAACGCEAGSRCR